MLKEEHRLRVFEIRVLRQTFGPKREEVAGGWRIFCIEEFHNLYASPNIFRVIKSRRTISAYVTHMGVMRNSYILVGKPEGKKPILRLRCR
jgi:hypothetical protein